mgnify:CR=1 FL=1
MNNAFSLKRYWILTRLTFTSNKKLITYFSLTIAVILLLTYLVCFFNAEAFYYPDDNTALQYALLVIGIGLTMTISSSLAFTHIHKKEKATSFYMIPARVSEKFMSLITVYTILPMIIYLVAFTLVSFIYIELHNKNGIRLADMQSYGANIPPFKNASLINPLYFSTGDAPLNMTAFCYFYLFTTCSIYLMGSALLKRHQFIQTMVYVGAYIIINVILLVNIFESFDKMNGFGVTPVLFPPYIENKYIYIYGTEYILCYGLPVIITGLCIYTAYQKVKRQQI